MARCERHAIAVLSQGSTWGSGGWKQPATPTAHGSEAGCARGAGQAMASFAQRLDSEPDGVPGLQ